MRQEVNNSLDNAIKQYLESHGFGLFEPKAVLFDMDGVLYNSMPHHAIAWVQAMEENKIPMSETDAYLYEGMRGVETITKLAWERTNRKLSIEEAQAIYDRKTEIFGGLGEVEKMFGVEDLMRQLQRDGLTIGVVTGSGQRPLLDRLERDFAGLVSRNHIVTAYDVTIGKPNPAPYNKGLEKCGVKANEAFVVENAPLGVKAGVNAGILTIAVNTGPLPDDILWEQGADIVLKDMPQLLELWKTRK